MIFPSLNLKARQQGAATLLVVMVLAIVMAVVSMTTARTGLMEQKIVGNDLRAREAQEAAEAGLEYGVAWAGKNKVPWPAGDTNIVTCPTTGCPALPQVTGSSTAETYNISSLIYFRPSPSSEFIRVTSISQGVNDTTITARAQDFVKPGGILSGKGKSPPPLVMDGCLTSTTGTPDIYPNWHDIDGDNVKDPNEWIDANGNGAVDTGEWTDTNSNSKVDNEMGTSIMTSKPEIVGGSFCLDYCGPGGGTCNAAGTETGHAHADLHDGGLQNNISFPNNSIWNYYFDVSQAEFQAAASTTLSTEGGLYWVTSTHNWAGGTYGSATNPIIIVFVNGCPKPSGNTTIYGILFFLEVDGCVTDPMDGWGNVEVYGSIGANGGVNQINANYEIHGVGDDAGGMQTINLQPINASRIPGTWKDF